MAGGLSDPRLTIEILSSMARGARGAWVVSLRGVEG
jgi:hypothetical protein